MSKAPRVFDLQWPVTLLSGTKIKKGRHTTDDDSLACALAKCKGVRELGTDEAVEHFEERELRDELGEAIAERDAAEARCAELEQKLAEEHDAASALLDEADKRATAAEARCAELEHKLAAAKKDKKKGGGKAA